MTSLRTLRALVPLAICLVLAACGGGGEAAAGGGAEDANGGPTSVTMKDTAFSPADVSVAAGDTVTWTNEDDAPHTVTFDDDALADSGQLAKGDDFETTFEEAGSYSYICAIHPDMKATVTVE